MVQSHADLIRAGKSKWHGMPPGISSAMADEIMLKLKAGSTVAKLTAGGKKFGPAMVGYLRFKKHCELHSEWAAEAWRLSNAASNRGRSENNPLRKATVC